MLQLSCEYSRRSDVDHKSVPGSKDEWADKAIEYAPQLALYREAVEKAAHQQVIATMIHVPVLGVLLKLNIGK